MENLIFLLMHVNFISGYFERKNEFMEKEISNHSEVRNTGFATKVNLQMYSKPEPRSWAKHNGKFFKSTYFLRKFDFKADRFLNYAKLIFMIV